MIISGNNSTITKSNNNSNILLAKNIFINNLDPNIVGNYIPQPGDIVTCRDGNQVLVDQYGNYYCDLDPNGDNLLPFSDVRCSNGTLTSVDINGNIINGCQPANGSEVTCSAGFTTSVENGTWSCAQGDENNGFFTVTNFTIPFISSNRITLIGYNESIDIPFTFDSFYGRIEKNLVKSSFISTIPINNRGIDRILIGAKFVINRNLEFDNNNSFAQICLCLTRIDLDYFYVYKTYNFNHFVEGLNREYSRYTIYNLLGFEVPNTNYEYIIGLIYTPEKPISGTFPDDSIGVQYTTIAINFYNHLDFFKGN